MINSLAHWEGLQPYTDEVTARGNLVSEFLLVVSAYEPVGNADE